MHIVLAKQNELHELVMGTQPTIDGTPQLGAVDAKQPRLCAGSVLNVATTAGALHLLSYLRASATHSHREMIDEVDAQVRERLLAPYLLTLPFGSASEANQTVAIGLDGNQLFGHLASAIAAHLIGQQDLWGGTYWWSLETQVPWVKRVKPELFTAAAAAEWVVSLGAASRASSDGEELMP